MLRLILLLPVMLAACATTGSNGTIAIDTVSRGQPITGAKCMASTSNGSWNFMTPAAVAVGSANGDLHVVCDKDGYRTSEMIFRPASPYGSSVGLGAGGGGGHVGLGLGLSVPINLGGGGYPSRITVEMNPQ